MPKPLTQQDLELKDKVQALLDKDYPESAHLNDAGQAYRHSVVSLLKQFTNDSSIADRKKLRPQLENYLNELQFEEDSAAPPSGAQHHISSTTTEVTTVQSSSSSTKKTEGHKDTPKGKAHPAPFQTKQVINTSLGSDIQVDERGTFDVSGLVVKGVTINVDNMRDKNDIEATAKSLQSIVDADKNATGFNNVKIGQDAKMNAPSAENTGVAFNFKFEAMSLSQHRQVTTEAISPTPPSSRQVLPPKPEDKELTASVKITLEQVYEGELFTDHLNAALGYLAPFENRFLKAAEKLHLQQYKQDKIELLRARSLIETAYGKAASSTLVDTYQRYGKTGGLLSAEEKQALSDLITELSE